MLWRDNMPANLANMPTIEDEFALRHWEYLLGDRDWAKLNAWAVAQLAREMAPAHPLYGQEVEVVAKAIHCDDRAFRLRDGRTALVHLCFYREPDPEGKRPWSAIYPDLKALLANLELWDDEECLIPGFDGAVFSPEWKDTLWVRFSTAAPPRQRRSIARSTWSSEPE